MRSRLVLLLFAAVLTARSADTPGSQDHPLIKRVSGSSIFYHAKADFDRLKLALGPLEWSGAEGALKPWKSATAEGQRLSNYYSIPDGIGVLEALRNYEQELRGQGFEILFSGIGEETLTPGYGNHLAREVLGMKGNYGTAEEKAQWPFQITDERKAGYLAARQSSADGSEVFASVYAVVNQHDQWLEQPQGRTLLRLDVCEVKARAQRMELVKSEAMAGEIALNGRVALYGILFDFDSAGIKPESDVTLAEIAKLLQEKPDLKILVVGHTDSSGAFEYNRTLSQKRAESVVASLTAKGIAKGRLFPVGVSFASPVATNHTDEGRAKNRRVELVDLAGGKVD